MKPTSLNTAVRKALEAVSLPGRGQTVVCALSGGADSVALLDALVSLGRLRGFRVVAAHLDHGLREGSGEDAAFCSSLCERLGVPLVSGRADVRGRAALEKGGLEQAARRERYAFLRRVQQESGAIAIAVAHTQDDQAETLLLRLLRGSGREGLGAMRGLSEDVVRPLLAVSRKGVLAHLETRGLAFREDPSNRDLGYARNRVRHELIPYLERHFNPRLRQTLARSARLLAAESELLDAITEEPRVLADGSAELPLAKLDPLALPLRRTLLRRALQLAGGLQGVSLSHIDGILGLTGTTGASGRSLSLPGGRVASVVFDTLRIGPRREPASPFAFPLAVPGRVLLPGGAALVAEAAPPGLDGEDAAGAATSEPLLVRTRRPGDRVRLHGRSRSLKRYLIERRVPADERARLPLVAAGSEVLWMPGQPLAGVGSRGLRLYLDDTPQVTRASPRTAGTCDVSDDTPQVTLASPRTAGTCDVSEPA